MENNTASDWFVATEEFVGGSLQGYVTCSYAELAKLFGDPGESDGYKSSTEWQILDTTTGKGFTLYDWKEPSLYSPGYPSVEQFRAKSSHDWHIGGDPDFKAISRFLTEKLGRTVTATRG